MPEGVPCGQVFAARRVRTKRGQRDRLYCIALEGGRESLRALCEYTKSRSIMRVMRAGRVRTKPTASTMGSKIGAEPWPTKTMSRDSNKGLLRGMRGVPKTKSFQTCAKHT